MEKEHEIGFVSVDAKGNDKTWSMTPSEMYERYNENGDLPALNDSINGCVFAGVHLYFETFSDMIYTFFGEQ